MDTKNKLIILIVVIAVILISIFAVTTTNGNTNDEITQVSTLTALVSGDYYGSISVGDLLKKGDFGLGTFDAINGEMIIIDGKCYQALGDGKVVEANSDTLVPFATLCYFEKDNTIDLSECKDMKELTAQLDKTIKENGANSIYAVKIHTKFNSINVRSEYSQKEPYKPLDEALQTSQTEFTYNNTEGTLVCLYFPDYMSDLNNPGWHIHFISDDRTSGGHVLNLSFNDAKAEFDKESIFTMLTPDTKSFQTSNITSVSDGSISAAEKNSNQ